MHPYQNSGSTMWSVSGRLGGGGIVKALVVFVFVLLVAAFVVGALFSDSYWVNPARERAEAQRIDIENKGMEARQEIGLRAYRQQKEAEAEASRARARKALVWMDRWHEVGIVLAIVSMVAVVTGVSIRLGAPAFAKIHQQHTDARRQMMAQRRELEEKAAERQAREAERLREERRLEQVRLQWARFEYEQLTGNGRERELHAEPKATSSWSAHPN